MKLQPAVKKETLHIAAGTALLVAAMFLVFAVLGRFDGTVLAGGLVGGALAVANFLLLGVTVQKITADANEQRGRKLMQFSYSMRMLLVAVWLILAVSLPVFHWVAAAVPLLGPRVTIGAMQLLGMYKKDEPKGEENSDEC